MLIGPQQPYRAEITNVETGETRERWYTEFCREGTIFFWEEGNFACDCNRELEFSRASACSAEPETTCSDNRFHVRLFEPDGRCFYDETD